MSQTKSHQNGQTTASESSHPNNGSAVGADKLIEQAEALKTSLRDSLAKTSELISALKQHKKTTKSLQSALSSLRQLESLGA